MEIIRAGLRTVVLGTLLLLATLVGISSGQSVDEYEVKAAFLYNFTKFVEWPRAIDSGSFSICVLGDDPFESAIDRLVNGKTVGGHPLQVRRIKDGADSRQCQIVFLSASEKGKASKLVETVRGSAVLTVGESQDFLRMGGMVFLATEKDRVNVVINAAATDGVGFKISAKLMTLARLYKP
jgi:hypothetical protein